MSHGRWGCSYKNVDTKHFTAWGAHISGHPWNMCTLVLCVKYEDTS